jgi:hypothetical protein
VRGLRVLALSGAVLLAAFLTGMGATAASGSAASCMSTLVQYAPAPAASQGTEGLPWIQASPASAGLIGQLYFYPGTTWQESALPRARIYPSGHRPDGGATKILWSARLSGTSTELVVSGKRLDAPGKFIQHFPVAGGGGSSVGYPSIIAIPRPGCWRLDLVSGTRRAYVTLLAVKPSA